MKHILITTIAAVLVVGCATTQQSVPSPESKPVDPVAEVPAQPPSPVESQPAETVAEAAQPEPTTAKAPDISIHQAAMTGNIEAVKQHLAAGVDLDAKNNYGRAPLHWAASEGRKEVAELLIAEGANVNAKGLDGQTPLDWAMAGVKKENRQPPPQTRRQDGCRIESRAVGSCTRIETS